LGQEDVAAPFSRKVVQLPVPGEEYCTTCDGHATFVGHWWHQLKPRLQATHWGYQHNFLERPIGVSVYNAFNTHVGNAQLAQLFLYHYDFDSEDRAKLNRFGRLRLRKLAAIFEHAPAPLRIETTHDTNLDFARRHAVATELEQLLGESVAMERIVASDVLHRGLQGDEALLNYQNMIQQTRQGATSASSGSSSGGGFAPSIGVGRGGGGSGNR
jgi:hypothetical protein